MLGTIDIKKKYTNTEKKLHNTQKEYKIMLQFRNSTRP